MNCWRPGRNTSFQFGSRGFNSIVTLYLASTHALTSRRVTSCAGDEICCNEKEFRESIQQRRALEAGARANHDFRSPCRENREPTRIRLTNLVSTRRKDMAEDG